LISNSKGISLSEISKGIQVPKSTTHKILETLKKHKFIELNKETEKYVLGVKAIEIGLRGLKNIDIVEISINYLKKLSAFTGETSFLGTYNEGQIVYLYKSEATNSIQTTAELGSRRPAYCTALGKSILAYLPIEYVDSIFKNQLKAFTDKTITERSKLYDELANIRANKYAIDDEEIEIGLTCFATPIFNYTGNVIGAISFAGPTYRVLENKSKNITELIKMGEHISKRLGYIN
ncbi:IclR family transcriptional regulator, partial [Parabacteroides distasonis]